MLVSLKYGQGSTAVDMYTQAWVRLTEMFIILRCSLYWGACYTEFIMLRFYCTYEPQIIEVSYLKLIQLVEQFKFCHKTHDSLSTQNLKVS